ncbi:MAG: hypothetical protein ABJA35_14115 [Parafilimonas sp.]
MKSLYHSYCRKLSAACLLVLFIFIHAIKAFHTHDFSAVQYHNTNKSSATVKAGFYCAICDFQLAKDSDTETSVIHISTPVHFNATCYGYILPTVKTFSFVFSVRGPPAVFC